MGKSKKERILPYSVSILGMKYKVTNKIPKEHAQYNGSDGLFIGDKHLIYINDAMSEEMQWRAFYHEFIHAIQYRSGISFTGISSEILEIMAETGASAIYELYH